MTPLHLATMSGNTKIVKKLLIRGSNKALKENNGATPADLAKEN